MGTLHGTYMFPPNHKDSEYKVKIIYSELCGLSYLICGGHLYLGFSDTKTADAAQHIQEY